MSIHRDWIDTPSAACVQQMQAWATEAVPGETCRFALLDRSFCSEREWRAAGLDGAAVPLYARYKDERMQSLSPALLALGEGTAERLQRLIDLGAGRPMLSLIRAGLSFQALIDYLRGRLEVTVEGEGAYFVRFADTRCLPVWARILDSGQHRWFFGDLADWRYIGRDGELARLVRDTPEAPAEVPSRIVLDADRYASLRQVATADTVLDYLRQRPNQFGRLLGRPSLQHACIEQVLSDVDDRRRLSADVYRRMLAALRAEQLLGASHSALDDDGAQDAA